MKQFETILGEDEKGSVALVELPFDPKAEFGKARPAVKVTVRGVVLRTTVSVYGGKSYIGFRREIREQAGLSPGMKVKIRIEADDEPRVIVAPADLRVALDANAEASAAWDKLSYSHRKEHVQALEQAKRPETRASRLEKTLEMLIAKSKPAKKKP